MAQHSGVFDFLRVGPPPGSGGGIAIQLESCFHDHTLVSVETRNAEHVVSSQRLSTIRQHSDSGGQVSEFHVEVST